MRYYLKRIARWVLSNELAEHEETEKCLRQAIAYYHSENTNLRNTLDHFEKRADRFERRLKELHIVT